MNLRGSSPAALAARCTAICITACAWACATPIVRSDVPPVRMVVTLSRAISSDASAVAALEARASRNTRLPARYVAAVSPTEHVIEVWCGDGAGCERVPASLRGDGREFVAVRVDARKRTSQP